MTDSSGPAAFKILLADFADYFDRAPRGAVLETLHKFGVRTGTPFSSYVRTLRVVVASTVEQGGRAGWPLGTIRRDGGRVGQNKDGTSVPYVNTDPVPGRFSN